MEESTKLVRDIVERNIAKDSFEWSSLKQEIREELNRNLYEKTKRRPMILPIIMEIKKERTGMPVLFIFGMKLP